RCVDSPVISLPAKETWPEFGFSIPMISFITVDFPDPFGPRSPRISPPLISNPTPLTATLPPNLLIRSRVSRRVSVAMPAPHVQIIAIYAVRRYDKYYKCEKRDYELIELTNRT